MKEMVLNSSFSLFDDVPIIPPSKAVVWNRKNDNLVVTPLTAPFSDHQTHQRPNSRASSFSGSASSISCSPFSFLTSPSESPFHRLLPSSAVPFSWEKKPGIPKVPAAAVCGGEKETHLLPLPPVLRSAAGHSRKKRSDAGNADPFAAALVQCAKDASLSSDDELDVFRWQRPIVKSVGIWRRGRISNRIGLVSFYGSCKATCSVSEATVAVHQPPRGASRSYGMLNRRSKST